jgi:hypothetical protein
MSHPNTRRREKGPTTERTRKEELRANRCLIDGSQYSRHHLFLPAPAIAGPRHTTQDLRGFLLCLGQWAIYGRMRGVATS